MSRSPGTNGPQRAATRSKGVDTGSIEPVDILRYARGFRDKWWLFLLLFVLTGGNVFYYQMRKRPEYRAAAEMKILRQPETFTRFVPLVDESLRTTEDVNTLIAVFQSPLFLGRVAARIRQEDEEQFLTPYRAAGDGGLPPTIETILSQNREISPERASLILTVSYSHPRPDVAAAVTNFFVEEFIAYERESQTETEQRGLRELRAQSEAQRRKIENLEKELVDFKERHNTISFDRKSDIDGQELLFLTNARNEDRRTLDILKNRIDVLDRVLTAGDPAWEAPFIAENPRVSQLVQSVAAHRMEIARLGARYRPEHPKMIEARHGLAGAESELGQVVEVEVASARNRYEQSLADFRSSEEKLDAKKQSILELQRLQADYDSMVRDVDSNREVYRYLYQRLQETEMQSRGAGINISLVSRASPPPAPFRPSLVSSAGLGIASGGLVAFTVVLLLLIIDEKVKSQRDIERDLGAPVLAALERLPGRDRQSLRVAGKALRTTWTRETLSALAAGLRLGGGRGETKTLLVTSTLGREGKTFTAAAVAGSFQRLGDRVVLLALDLRAPDEGLPGGMRPLGELLTGAPEEWRTFVTHDENTGVDVVHGGRGRIDNPYALFNSPVFARFIERLQAEYDRVVIDTPPLSIFGDALALSPFADRALFVIRFNKVPLRLARRALGALEESGLPLAGVVVNGVRPLDIRVYFPGHQKRRGPYRNHRIASTDQAPAEGKEVEI